MKKTLIAAVASLAFCTAAFADTTYTLNNQTVTKFRAYSTVLHFETNGFSEGTCDDESIRLNYGSDSSAQLFSILRDAAENNSQIKTIQYFWDSSEENCYVRFIDLK